MNKLTTRLEQLADFKKRGDVLKQRAQGIQTETQNLDKEFGLWLETELGLKGNLHMAEVLTKALETSFEPPAPDTAA